MKRLCGQVLRKGEIHAPRQPADPELTFRFHLETSERYHQSGLDMLSL
jgi:hypothetical protein